MSTETLHAELRGSVLEVTFNRPKRLNAINQQLIAELDAQLDEAAAGEARAVLLRGEGRGFCAGGDIHGFKEMLESGHAVARDMPDRLHDMIEKLRHLPMPVVAAVHGPCAGAGFALAIACDAVVAADDATFNTAYLAIGLSPDGSSTFFLPRHVGMKKAMEMFLAPRNMTAQEVLELGLINRVVPAAELVDRGRQFAALLAGGPTAAYARLKQLINASYENSLHDQLVLETDCVVECSATEDFRAGVTAFLAKKMPAFKGR